MSGAWGARFARTLVRLGHRRPGTVLAVTAAVVALGISLASRLTFETDVMNLVPRHDRVVQDFKRVMEEFGSLDTLLVAVPVGDEEGLEVAFSLVDALAEELAGSTRLSRVEAHLDDPVKLAETVLRHAVLYLDEEGLHQLEKQLTTEGLRARAADIRSALDTPHGMLAKELAVRDPLGFLPLLLGRVSRTPASLKVDFSSGYFLSANHSMVLLLAKPVLPAQNIDFDEALFADLDARIERARRRVAEEQEIDLTAVPEVLLGGGHRTAVEDARLIKSDIVVNSVTSLLGVMVLFYLAYRRFATVHYAFLPLVVGLAMTFGFAAIAVGSLSSATAGFAALLVGLGIDFTIVTYGRYLEERAAGRALGDALGEMAAHSGPSVMLGAFTTMGTFYAFLATRFQGLREFGLLTGTGIVLMMLSTLLVLPALVTLFDRKKELHPPVRLLAMGPALRWVTARRKPVLVTMATLSLLALALVPRLRFDDDVRNLRSSSNRGVEIQERLAKAFGLSFNAMMVRIEAPTTSEAMDRVHLLAAGLDQLVAKGVISSHESLSSLVPPATTQRRALEWAAAHRDLADPERVRQRFAAALAGQGLVPGAFEAGLAGLDSTLRPTAPVSLEIWQGTPVQQVVDRSLRSVDGRMVTVVNVFAPPGMWRREAPRGLVGLVASVPGATLTGVNLVSKRLRHIVWQDAALAGGVGLILVLGLLFWRMRRLSDAFACMMPVAVGVFFTLGIMVLFGLSLNLLNAFVITMIIGVGSDYAIYIVNRIREGADLNQLGETARAVLFSALTTVVGFGSLVTTHYPGLRSIGWMTALGVVFSGLAAVFVLPLLVREEK